MPKDLDNQPQESGQTGAHAASDVQASRRKLLQLGAIGVPLVLTPKTGLAQTMASVNCAVVLDPGDTNFGLSPGDPNYLQEPQTLPIKTLSAEQLNTGSFVGDVSGVDYNGAYMRYLEAMVDGNEQIDTASCLASLLTVQERTF